MSVASAVSPGILLLALCVCQAFLCIACAKNSSAHVRVEADKIHGYIRTEDFDQIYVNASPRIRECYSSARFSEQMASLVQRLRAADPQLSFREVKEETEKADAIRSSSDMFADMVFAVGPDDGRVREVLFFKNENDVLRLFAYRVLDGSQAGQDVRSSMIGCAQSN